MKKRLLCALFALCSLSSLGHMYAMSFDQDRYENEQEFIISRKHHVFISIKQKSGYASHYILHLNDDRDIAPALKEQNLPAFLKPYVADAIACEESFVKTNLNNKTVTISTIDLELALKTPAQVSLEVATQRKTAKERFEHDLKKLHEDIDRFFRKHCKVSALLKAYDLKKTTESKAQNYGKKKSTQEKNKKKKFKPETLKKTPKKNQKIEVPSGKETINDHEFKKPTLKKRPQKRVTFEDITDKETTPQSKDEDNLESFFKTLKN